MDFLFLFIDIKYVDNSSRYGGPHYLVSSPSIDSTFITYAPKSESIIVANGPTNILDRSRILILYIFIYPLW